MPYITLYTWIQKGRITARKVLVVGSHAVWVIRADAAELRRLRARRVAGTTRGPRRRSSPL